MLKNILCVAAILFVLLPLGGCHMSEAIKTTLNTFKSRESDAPRPSGVSRVEAFENERPFGLTPEERKTGNSSGEYAQLLMLDVLDDLAANDTEALAALCCERLRTSPDFDAAIKALCDAFDSEVLSIDEKFMIHEGARNQDKWETTYLTKSVQARKLTTVSGKHYSVGLIVILADRDEPDLLGIVRIGVIPEEGESVNMEADDSEIYTYNTGTVCELNSDFFETPDDAAPGYSIRVDDSELLSTQMFEEKFAVEIPKKAWTNTEYMYCIKTVIRNDADPAEGVDEEGNPKWGIPFLLFVLEGENQRFSANETAIRLANTNLTADRRLDIKPGEERAFVFVYSIAPDCVKELEQNPPRMVVSQFPTKKMMIIV